MRTRVASIKDTETIRSIHLSAFPNNESHEIAVLAVRLLLEASTPPTLSFIAEVEDHAVGHIALSPTTIHCREKVHGYILAPLAIQPSYQNQGIGTQLVNTGIKEVSAMGADVLFVYGNPQYYSRFGFSAEDALRYVPPYMLQFPFGWQCHVMRNTIPESSQSRISCVPALSNPILW